MSNLPVLRHKVVVAVRVAEIVIVRFLSYFTSVLLLFHAHGMDQTMKRIFFEHFQIFAVDCGQTLY